MDGLTIRAAETSDAVQAGELILASLYGYGTYLTGLGRQDRAAAALKDYFRLPANRFSYQFSHAAWVGGEIAGLLVAFPGYKLLGADFITALQMPRVYNLGEIGRFVKRVLILHDEEEVERDEFYIANLAVSIAQRKKGIGWSLLEFAEGMAKEAGMKRMSLMVENENGNAIALYEKFGFEIIKTYLHPHQMALTGSPGYKRMVKNL